MSDRAVEGIRHDLNDLRDEVRSWGAKIDLIHKAVVEMSGKVYVPGPPPQSSGQTE